MEPRLIAGTRNADIGYFARVGAQTRADPFEDIRELWSHTLGDRRIAIAILDGPIDLSHPSLVGAGLTQVNGVGALTSSCGPACRHGTHIASAIFGQHDGPVLGIAPRCRGISIPIFESNGTDGLGPCTQLDLARAIALALQQGAQVINISAGQFSPCGTAYPLLEKAVEDCVRAGVLIIAAAGNDGCECLHVPAALNSVLAVGAMNRAGEPLGFSNWGRPYDQQGLLAPGESILGAAPGGGSAPRSGTSYATAVVSGVAALLLSLQVRQGQRINTARVREAFLRTAIGCDQERGTDCRRLLAGRLNVKGAASFIVEDQHTMSESMAVEASEAPTPLNGHQSEAAPALPAKPQRDGALAPSAVQAAECSCKGAQSAPPLIYALGQIGYDLVNEARLDALAQKIAGQTSAPIAQRVLAFDARKLLSYLEQNSWDAAAIEWILYLDGTPIYAIRPQGPFAADAYRTLREFLKDQLDEAVERVSIPGYLAGRATLLMGQTVPVLVPELRGMYSWTTGALLNTVVGPAPAAEATQQEKEAHGRRLADVRNFLDRVYHALRNLGVTPQERALNFAATNAFEIEEVYEKAIHEKMELDSINVVRSPICRPLSDCWDVEVYFFYPERQVQTVRKVFRFTVDVSDTVPVTVGPMRSWFTR